MLTEEQSLNAMKTFMDRWKKLMQMMDELDLERICARLSPEDRSQMQDLVCGVILGSARFHAHNFGEAQRFIETVAGQTYLNWCSVQQIEEPAIIAPKGGLIS